MLLLSCAVSEAAPCALGSMSRMRVPSGRKRERLALVTLATTSSPAEGSRSPTATFWPGPISGNTSIARPSILTGQPATNGPPA